MNWKMGSKSDATKDVAGVTSVSAALLGFSAVKLANCSSPATVSSVVLPGLSAMVLGGCCLTAAVDSTVVALVVVLTSVALGAVSSNGFFFVAATSEVADVDRWSVAGTAESSSDSLAAKLFSDSSSSASACLTLATTAASAEVSAFFAASASVSNLLARAVGGASVGTSGSAATVSTDLQRLAWVGIQQRLKLLVVRALLTTRCCGDLLHFCLQRVAPQSSGGLHQEHDVKPHNNTLDRPRREGSLLVVLRPPARRGWAT
mmetsp:Transcript_52560/g.112548  ORF Transcript_52560/g.112548 Transcript_52560/m.112548 type:complete len:261 (+) Transcript_52560:341-1123(+)